MKKMICLLAALVLCFMAVSPAYAAEDDFVPSITYKDGPEIVDSDLNGLNIDECLIVTTIQQAKDKTTNIPQETRDLLLEVYEKLMNDTMKLPIDEDYVVVHLVDVSWTYECVDEEDHGHKEWLDEEGNILELTFDLGISASSDVTVYLYEDGEWVQLVSKNNEDGTLTAIFETKCPVAFVMNPKDQVSPPPTGDLAMGQILTWGALMAASAAVLVFVLVMRRKEAQA